MLNKLYGYSGIYIYTYIYIHVFRYIYIYMYIYIQALPAETLLQRYLLSLGPDIYSRYHCCLVHLILGSISDIRHLLSTKYVTSECMFVYTPNLTKHSCKQQLFNGVFLDFMSVITLIDLHMSIWLTVFF